MVIHCLDERFIFFFLIVLENTFCRVARKSGCRRTCVEISEIDEETPDGPFSSLSQDVAMQTEQNSNNSSSTLPSSVAHVCDTALPNPVTDHAIQVGLCH